MRKTWFDLKLATADTPAVISIYDNIGMWGVTAKDFIASLSTVAGDKLTLNINSPGGSVFDALAIFNALKQSGKDITVYVMGIAASAASYIAMVGNKIVMPDNTFMMVHNPLNAIYGNAADMREMADVLDKIGNSLVSTYVARTGLDDAKVRELLANESYLTAAECLELGFADEVAPAVEVTASFEREHMPEHIQALFKATSASDEGDANASDSQDDSEADIDEPTFAEQVEALAEKTEFSDLTATMLLDPSLDTIEKVKARLSEAREIKSLCVVAKAADKAAGFIASGKTLAEARTALCECLVASSESTTVDTTQSSSNKPISGACPSAVKTADMWATYQSRKPRS